MSKLRVNCFEVSVDEFGVARVGVSYAHVPADARGAAARLKERALRARGFHDDGMAKSNVEIVQAVYAAFGRRDKIALAMLIAGDIEIVQSTALPWGGEFHGFSGLKQFFETLLAHVDSQVEFERMIDAGDHVAAVGWVSGTVRANGREFRIPIVHLWKIRDGRAAAFHPYIENALMLEALAGA